MKLEDLGESRHSEEDVAAEFCHRIKSDGRLKVRREVKLPSTRHRSGRFRVDAIIEGRDGNIVCAVEFKRPGKGRISRSCRQYLAYKDLPFPFFYVQGHRRIGGIIRLIFALAGLEEPIGGAFDSFGKSAISRTGRIKGKPAYIGR